MFKPAPFFLALSIVLSGCMATAPVQRQFEKQATIPGATFDQVWNGVIDLFGERNWTIANMEKSSGFINSDWMNSFPRDGFFDCGGSGIATASGWKGRFNVIVREPATAGDGVQLTVNTTWQANVQFMDTVTPIDCLSTGLLEKSVQDAIGAKTRGGQ